MSPSSNRGVSIGINVFCRGSRGVFAKQGVSFNLSCQDERRVDAGSDRSSDGLILDMPFTSPSLAECRANWWF